MIKNNWLNWREIMIDDRGLSFGAKGMALYLNTFMNGKNDFAFPSIATICGEMSIGSKTTAIKYLDELCERGWLIREKRFSRSTIYHLRFPENVKSEIDAVMSSSPESVLVQNMNHSSPESGLTVVQNLDSNNQVNNQVNKQEVKKVSKTDQSVSRKEKKGAVNNQFEEFWDKFDYKLKRKDCLAKFKKLSEQQRKAAIAGITRFKQNENNSYKTHALTYLNGERWDDMPANAVNGSFDSIPKGAI